MMELGRLRSGEAVYDAKPSHLPDHPGVKELLPEVLGLIDSDGVDFVATVNLERVVGLSHCVETQPGDCVVYRVRGEREWATRFVLDREPEPTSLVTVVLVEGAWTGYVLVSAWFGPVVPPEPEDPRATPESESFWASHALTWKGVNA